MIITETAENVADKEASLYSPEQLVWRQKARKFAQAIPVEDIVEADRKNMFRRDLFEKACQEGFGSLPFPTTYGGSGGDYVSFCLVNEEFGRACVPVMSSLGVHVLCQEPVYRFGTEEQKTRYLLPSSQGKYLAAFGLTEPAAGSDTAALKTTARLDGDYYVLNGTKVFITSGGAADYFIVMAKLEGAGPSKQDDPQGSKLITAFLVESSAPGFAIGQKFDMLGMRGYATCEIVMTDCRVPRSSLLGQAGQGRKVALSSLAKGRVTIAAQCVGWAQGALDGICRHLGSLHQKGLIDDSLNGMAYLLGDLAIQVESARALTIAAASAVDRGEGDVTLAAMAKVQASDIAVRAATEAISIVGRQGTAPGLLLERIFRDAKAGPIYEGTNQIQRLLIARHLLK